MLKFLFPFLVGSVLGLLAGLGVGGGSLLLLWLTQVAMFPYVQARITNLLFYFPTALASLVFRKKEERPDKKLVIPAILSGCISAVIFTFLGRYLNHELLKKFFGGLLILVGVREIFYRPRKAK